jgi:hypothetical protein
MLKQSSALTGSMPPAAISTLVILAPIIDPMRPVQLSIPQVTIVLSLLSGSSEQRDLREKI